MVLAAVRLDENGNNQEGAAENSTAVGSLLGLIIAGDLTRGLPILAIFDGAKALSKPVADRFGQDHVQRCWVHKVRNVLEHLPLAKWSYFKAKKSLAYRLPHEQVLNTCLKLEIDKWA